ncbi:unnamed protein product [Rangifer tarandus platyrhynchus]|uniref:Uncharacterized protein n=2 Tax=Rangifer tarandus platyrhynchus TaxID=3082113 RepID=A0AC60A9C1_RANTA|nr:unnamed protein product [Rangifer tarandus platyrhynchus]
MRGALANPGSSHTDPTHFLSGLSVCILQARPLGTPEVGPPSFPAPGVEAAGSQLPCVLRLGVMMGHPGSPAGSQSSRPARGGDAPSPLVGARLWEASRLPALLPPLTGFSPGRPCDGPGPQGRCRARRPWEPRGPGSHASLRCRPPPPCSLPGLPQPLPSLPSAPRGVTGAARGLTYSGRSERLTRGWGAGQGEAGEAEARCCSTLPGGRAGLGKITFSEQFQGILR